MAIELTEMESWKALAAHAEEIKGTSLKELFAADELRAKKYAAEAYGILLDYSKNRINDQTLKLLIALAKECGVAAKRDAMFRGDKINITENRAVLHVALRAPKGTSIVVDGENVVPAVHEVLDKMSGFRG